MALHKKLEFAKSSEMASNSAAMQDIAPELERLRAKAVTKSRDILMNRCTPTHIPVMPSSFADSLVAFRAALLTSVSNA